MNHIIQSFIRVCLSFLMCLSAFGANVTFIYAENSDPTSSEITSITVKANKSEYKVGEMFASSDLTVNAVLANNNTEVLDSTKYTLSGFDTTSTGNKTVTVMYSSTITTTYQINVTQNTISVADVSIEPSTLALKTGEISTLKAIISPSNATNQNVTWTSSSSAVTVDQSGKVTANTAGTATITVKTEDGNKTGSCSVSVTDPIISVTGVSVSPSSLSLKIGDTASLTASVSPSNATTQKVTWTSSNPSIVSVDASGNIKANIAGGVSIVATTADGLHTAYCNISVSALTRSDRIQHFITFLYSTTLDRNPDPTGLNYWENKLSSGSITGSWAVYNFVFGNEFKSKNYCNKDYINHLYRAIFSRDPDPTGFSFWKNQMANGRSRESVLNGFLNSAEFNALCATAGIVSGGGVNVSTRTVQTGPCPLDGDMEGVGGFAIRLYSKCLGRSGDKSGLTYWTQQISNGNLSGSYAAYQFFFSTEFINLGTSNEEYLTRLYETFFDRYPDSTGKNYWISILNSGASRYYVLQQFANSAEWQRICASYGIGWSPVNYVIPTPVFYSQGDRSWSHAMFGQSTIGLSGCGVATMAMIIQTKTGIHVTPFDVASYLHSIGLYNNGSLLGTNGSSLVEAGKKYGLSSEYVGSYEKLVSVLEQGKLVAWQVVGNPFVTIPGYSHDIVLYGYDHGNVNVLDPNSGVCSGVYSAMDLCNHRSDNPSDLDLGVPGIAF